MKKLMTYSPENKSFGRIFKKFAFETNIEGVNNAGRSTSLHRAAIWLSIFTILVALTVKDIKDLVNDYMGHPVDVSTTLAHQNAVDFPAVTICNKNRVSCRNLENFLEKCKEKDTPCKNPNELENLFILGKCNVTSKLEIPSNRTVDAQKPDSTLLETIRRPKTKPSIKTEGVSNIKENLQSVQQSDTFASEQQFLMMYLMLTEEEKFNIGHSFEDLVVSCTFRGVDCLSHMGSDEQNIFLDYHDIVTPTHGNCYTIYSEDESAGKSSFTGSAYGLSLVLNIEQSDYLRGGQTLAAGARVTIQDRYGFPLIDEYGIDVAPNALTSISLQVVDITRHTYSGCTSNNWTDSEYNTDEDMATEFVYSVAACQKLCIQENIQKICECSHPLFEPSEDFRPCNLSKAADNAECVLEQIIMYDIGEKTCNCDPPCEEIDYEKLVSSTVWPNMMATMAFSELYGVDPEDVKEDYLKVDIYFMSLNVKSITETARYTLVSFISALGGNLGVWVGFSVCMIFEVIELIIDLFILLVCRIKK